MLANVIDIETTGLLKYDENGTLIPDILEYAYITVDTETLQVLDNGTLYFYRPDFDIENDAQKIHGLTRDFLKQYEGDFFKNLCALNAMYQNGLFIGKNSNRFDLPFIKSFIEKYGKLSMDIQLVVNDIGMKGYKGGVVIYENNVQSIDVQETYKTIWQEKTNQTRRGKLEEYIESIENGEELVHQIYDGLKKDRVTGYHGALYDAACTYLVWLMSIIEGNKE